MTKNMKNQTQSSNYAEDCKDAKNSQSQNNGAQSRNKSTNKSSNKAGTNKTSSGNTYDEAESEY